jgi:hypothetical protein
MKNNYLNRWLGTIGIYGNSKQEAIYPIYRIDASGQKLEGANRYSLRFAPGQLPPVNAFWSLTMYEPPQSPLVANPLNRYLLNSPMLPRLKKDPDGCPFLREDRPIPTRGSLRTSCKPLLGSLSLWRTRLAPPASLVRVLWRMHLLTATLFCSAPTAAM